MVRYLLRILLGLVLGAVVVAGYSAYLYTKLEPRPAPVFEGPPSAPAFSLVDQEGRRVTNADLAGKVWIANFVFTRCGELCDALSANMARLQAQLAEEELLGDDVMLITFTVDPLTDTPGALKEYADAHGANPGAWRFLTGSTDAVQAVLTAGFFVPARGRDVDQGAFAAHYDAPPHPVVPSDRFVLVDQFGKVQGHYDGQLPALEMLLHDVRFLVETG